MDFQEHSTYVSEDNSTFSLRLFTPLVLYRKMDITEIWRVVKEGVCVMILFWFLYCSACSPISSVVYGGDC